MEAHHFEVRRFLYNKGSVCASLRGSFGLRMMDNLVCEETFEREALSNKNKS